MTGTITHSLWSQWQWSSTVRKYCKFGFLTKMPQYSIELNIKCRNEIKERKKNNFNNVNKIVFILKIWSIAWTIGFDVNTNRFFFLKLMFANTKPIQLTKEYEILKTQQYSRLMLYKWRKKNRKFLLLYSVCLTVLYVH